MADTKTKTERYWGNKSVVEKRDSVPFALTGLIDQSKSSLPPLEGGDVSELEYTITAHCKLGKENIAVIVNNVTRMHAY